jgi:hypothetical protein
MKAGVGIGADPVTAGEWASYKFSFVLSQLFAETDKIVIWFPMTYDPFIGRASLAYLQDSGTYYLDCNAPAIGTAWCTVQHWKVMITGTKAPKSKDMPIEINFPSVQNPAENASPSAFKIAHVDKSDTYIAYNDAFDSVQIKPCA